MTTSASGPKVWRVPEGDDRERLVCDDCGYVVYHNPRMVVGVVATWNSQILICKRAIDPRKGYWTLPAGFLELNETPQEGAAREAWEEARAKLEIEALLAMYAVRRISQIQVFYQARLLSDEVEPGPESLDVDLVRYDDVPWDELAFPTVRWALTQHRSLKGLMPTTPFVNPEGET